MILTIPLPELGSMKLKKQQKQQSQNRQELEEQEKQIKRISFSELKNWKECSYRHKLIYVDKLPYYSSNEYSIFGTAIHEACESLSTGNIYSIFKKKFIEEIKSLALNGHKTNKKLVLEMVEQAKPICDHVLPKMREHFGDFKIHAIEEPLLEEITEFDSYDKKFKGFIDLVLKTPDDKYHIVDWKTCSWGWSRDKKSDPIINYQLTYYKNFFAKKHNITPKNIETYFVLLKRTAKKNVVEVVRTTSGPKKTSNALKVLENAVINIERETAIKNKLNCKYCKFYKTEHCT